jgi:Phosphoribosyl synthetase-associated domain
MVDDILIFGGSGSPKLTRKMTALIVDDFTISAGTLTEAADKLVERGAKAVYAAVSHGVFSAGSMERLDRSPIQRLMVTDSIETQPVVFSPRSRSFRWRRCSERRFAASITGRVSASCSRREVRFGGKRDTSSPLLGLISSYEVGKLNFLRRLKWRTHR